MKVELGWCRKEMTRCGRPGFLVSWELRFGAIIKAYELYVY